MVAPGDERDVVALLEQAGPDGAPDGTGPHDDEAHGVHSATCQALPVASLNPVERAAALGRLRRRGPAAPGRRAGRTRPGRHGAHRAARHRDQGGTAHRSPTTPTRPTCRPTAWPGRSTPTCPPCSSAASALSCSRSLHPLAMAGVAEHSSYREDPLGPAAADGGVRRHDDLRDGRRGGGRHRPGAAGPPPGQGDRARRAAVLGGRSRAGDVHPRGRGLELPGLVAALRAAGPSRPRSATATTRRSRRWRWPSGRPGRRARPTRCESYLLRMRPELYAGPQAKAARDWLVRGVARRPGERAVYSLVLAAAVGVLPGWARRGARAVARRPPRPVRRHRRGDPAHARAHRRPALDGDPAGLRCSGGDGEPAVDDHDLAGDVGGAGQRQDHLGHVLGLPRALERRDLAAPPRGRRPSPRSTACRRGRAPRR